MTTYEYALTEFLNDKIDLASLKFEIEQSAIVTALEHMTSNYAICEINFKGDLSAGDETILEAIVAAHMGVHSEDSEPHMPDGRPIVRADTRPLDTSTYFTMAGDSTAIGTGVEFRWDFSNDDDEYTGPEVPSGYKAKAYSAQYCCPINVKDGTIYFFDAPWGAHVYFDIVVPDGEYYKNPAGAIPAAALGQPGNDMYAQADGDTLIHRYVNKHRIYGDCPMGDELNAEGSSVDALPIGWYIRALIVTPTSDDVSKGYGSLEMYRCHTALLPGQTIDDLH